MNSIIYLDNAATTRVFDSAIKSMEEVYSIDYFNPSSTYKNGIIIKNKINTARTIIAQKLNCAQNEIFFTSCATESNNWALTCGFKNKKGNIVVSLGEHACVYECVKNMKNSGADVRFAKLLPDGRVDIDHLLSLVDENTSLVSVIHASNETGAINDLSKISTLIKKKNPKVIFHSDGVQAYLKTNNNVKALGVDMYSISGHKIGAPKGIGVLYISSKIKIRPLIFGGGQENGMRSGTENVAGIVALAVASEEYSKLQSNNRVKELRDVIVKKLHEIPDVTILSENCPHNNHIIAFCAERTKAEIIQTMCCDDGLIIGRGSACSSHHSGNRVLNELGLSQKLIDGALRLSLSPLTTKEEVDRGLEILKQNIEKLRGHKIG